MRRFLKGKKKGFTLIEILLAMAIMIIMMTIVWGTFAIINQSHANVVVVNDAKDFAEFYMEAINSVVSNSSALTVESKTLPGGAQPSGGGYSRSIYIDPTTGVLKFWDGATLKDALNIQQFKVSTAGGEKNKWIIDPIFRLDGDTLFVELKVIDNSDNTLYTTLKRTLYLSNLTKVTASTGDGNVIFFTTKNFPITQIGDVFWHYLSDYLRFGISSLYHEVGNLSISFFYLLKTSGQSHQQPSCYNRPDIRTDTAGQSVFATNSGDGMKIANIYSHLVAGTSGQQEDESAVHQTSPVTLRSEMPLWSRPNEQLQAPVQNVPDQKQVGLFA